jgi:hypothetical protein
VLGAGALVAAPPDAVAGRRDHAWLRGAEVLPERMVELEAWVFEKRGLFDAVHETWFAWQPVVGVTDQLELALPLEVIVPRAEDGTDLPTEVRYGVEARWRLVSGDPVDAPPIVPLVRAAIGRGGTDNTGRFDAGIAISIAHGRIRGAADVGASWVLRRGVDGYVIRPAFGVSVLAIGDLRVGIEGYGDIDPRDTERAWFALGPDLAWTHGRFWLTAAFPIGLSKITAAPRIGWGIAF